MKKNLNAIIVICVILSLLIIIEISIFFNDSNIHKSKNYTLNQNSKMVDYHLGNEILFNNEDIEFIINAEKYSEANTYDLTNIALRGCNFYYEYLRTNETKYAQLTFYYANFLLTEDNFYEFENHILFPSHLGYKISKINTIVKNYEDAMGASYAAILFINCDELLFDLNISNNYYLESAIKVAQGIILSYKAGGGRIPISDTESWFIHHNKEKRVLNGHMFTIANLIRYMYYTSDLSVYQEINKGIHALKNSLNLYLRENKQMYDLKIFVHDINYEQYFSPYYEVHPLLLYYLYKNTLDIELLNYYSLFMESSLFECKYSLDANPFLLDGKFHFNVSMISDVENIFTSTIYPYDLKPTPEYFYREPIVDFDLLNSINFSYSIQTSDDNEILKEKLFTDFTTDIFFDINFSKLYNLKINMHTSCYNLKINCIIEENQISIEEKKLVVLDSSEIVPNKKHTSYLSIVYESIIILATLFFVLLKKRFEKGILK